MMFSKKLKAAGLILLILVGAVLAMGQGFNTISNVILSGFTQRAKPTARTDSASALSGARFGRYGEHYVSNVVPNKVLLADEGSYFVSGTTTSVSIGSPNTIPFTQSTAFSATKAVFVIKNNDSVGGKRIYLDYVKLFNWTTAPTSAVSVNMAVELDNVTRTPTAGGTAQTVVNANMDDATGSIALLTAVGSGAPLMLTVPAAGAGARQVTQCLLKSQIPVVRDSLECYFGAVDGSGGTMGATGGRFVSNGAPVVIGPQQYAVFHIWAPSAAADPNAEYELAWWER
jgi:hypothetical protein